MILVKVYGNLNLLTKRLVLHLMLFSCQLIFIWSHHHLLAVMFKPFKNIYHLLSVLESHIWWFFFALVIGPHEQERFVAVLVDPIPYGKQVLWFIISVHNPHNYLLFLTTPPGGVVVVRAGGGCVDLRKSRKCGMFHC